MHPNPVFRGTEREISLSFARKRGFGVLSVNADPGPLLSHIPFILDDAGTLAELHLVRSNPIARALRSGPLQAVIAVTGPDAYVSPDWYGLPDQVPTWNYVAVHLRGTLSLAPVEDLRDLLDRQSAVFEEALRPKAPWTMDKVSDDAAAKLMRSILPCRFEVASVDSTWKLGQNKPEAARLGAAKALDELGQDALAELMRQPPPKEEKS